MVPGDEGGARDTQLLRGNLELCVLAAIATRPSHAYEIVVRLQGHGLTGVGHGTIYPLVTRLRGQGLLQQASLPSPSGPPRNELRLTPAGLQALADWRERSMRARVAVEAVLADLDHAEAVHE